MYLIKGFKGIDWLILMFGIIVLFTTAFNSQGYFHGDEHWQVLEFASYKAGHTPQNQLPWEYNEQIRPAIQPFIVYTLMNVLPDNTSPFTVVLILRLFTALGAFAVLCMSFKALNVLKVKNTIEILLIVCSFWFLPFLCVRFTSENCSGICLASCVFLVIINEEFLMIKHYLIIGFFLGLAFLFRFQCGLSIAGFIMWLMFIKKVKIKDISILTLVIFLVICLGFCIDRWFYGEWTNTIWNYFNTTILIDNAPDFGSKQWYFYFIKIIERSFFIDGIIILSFLMLYLKAHS